MALSAEKLKAIMDVVYSDANRKRIKSDFQKYMIYNGQLRDEIEKAITNEFILPETINELCKRIIPINIVQKIISKLAKVYSTPPSRAPLEPLDQDVEALEFHESVLNPNKHMKDANRLFKLHKNDAIEPYASSKGEPCMRVNPSYSYTLFSDDPIEPNRHTVFVKHMKWDEQSRENDRHLIWTDEDQVMVDGGGKAISEDSNPYGVMPFVVIKDSENFLTPIPDDDIVNIQFAICLLLTDLAFAAKYQSWSIFYTIGVDSKNMTFNPNSVVSLVQKDPDGVKPEIGTIKPELDSDEMLRLVEALVGLLLTTKSLSIGNVSTKLDSANTASGVAKLFDSAESTEDRTDQIEYFRCGEEEFWMMYAHEILPRWIELGMIRPEFYVPFSKDFILSIEFPEQKPIVSDKEKIETSEVAIKAGLSSRRREIKRLNPDMDESEIDKLIREIDDEKDANMEKTMNSMNQGLNGQENKNQLPESDKPNGQ